MTELAQEWQEMEEYEQLHFRQDFTRAFGLRKELGALYLANRLSQRQTGQLTELDRQTLTLAADLETIYGVSLRQLLQNLLQWGTPLTQQKGPLQITTTIPALFELA